MKYYSVSNSLLTFLFTVAITQRMARVVAQNPIKIDAIDSATFVAANSGESTVVVNYILDGASLGASNNNNADFYVLQSIQDHSNCNNEYAGGLTSLDGATEPTVADSQSTTTLVNTADWTTGDVKFCLRIKLMLQLTDGTDLLWHQMDFKFTVTVGIEGGTADVYFVENGGVAESLIFQENGVETSDGHSITVGDAVAPTFATSLAVVGPFGYGDDIPITITFNHPLDIFTYSVDAENVVPVDELNAQLMSGGDPIPLRSSSFVMDSINHATGITGTLTMTFPLVLYQLPSTSSVRIKIPVSWTGKTRRHLRELTEQMANSDYTGPSSGSVNELVEVELDPYIDGSGAIIGFTLRGMVALSCAAATVILH